MPIYEYACRACGKTFEAFLLRRSEEAEVACPDCDTREVERVMSRPAAVSGVGASGASGGGGGGCAPGG
jgi:putative FmdB family regulatory protein